MGTDPVADGMASFDRWLGSVQPRLSSAATAPSAKRGAGGGGAPDPRLKAAALHQAAAPQRQMAAGRQRVPPSDPALASARSLAEQNLARQEQLKGLKDQLRDLESQFTQALSVQSHKESKYRLATESVSNTTAENQKLNDSVMDLMNNRDKCAAVISDQLQALETLEAKSNEDAALLESIEKYISWYHKFLGFKIIIGGGGVKLVFNKIDLQRPEKEFSICIKIDNDKYSLLQCDPPIGEFEELVKDLNLSGDLFKFVRIAREKFQASSVDGLLPLPSSVVRPDVPSLPFSPPVMTSANKRSEDVPNQSSSRSKNRRPPAKRKATAPSPGSVRRSPRFEAPRRAVR